jgi:hypothetical protein
LAAAALLPALPMAAKPKPSLHATRTHVLLGHLATAWLRLLCYESSRMLCSCRPRLHATSNSSAVRGGCQGAPVSRSRSQKTRQAQGTGSLSAHSAIAQRMCIIVRQGTRRPPGCSCPAASTPNCCAIKACTACHLHTCAAWAPGPCMPEAALLPVLPDAVQLSPALACNQ